MKTLETVLVALVVGLVVGFWPTRVPRPPVPVGPLGALVRLLPPRLPPPPPPEVREPPIVLPESARLYGAPGWEKTRAALAVDRAILANTPLGYERD